MFLSLKPRHLDEPEISRNITTSEIEKRSGIVPKKESEENSKAVSSNIPNIISPLNSTLNVVVSRKIQVDREPDTLTSHISTKDTSNTNLKDILKHKLTKNIISSYIYVAQENKTIFSATELTVCPIQTWYKLKGRITEEMLDHSKIFYLLDLYSISGTAIHNHIYKVLGINDHDVTITDEKNRIKGKYDIYIKESGTLIDIKTSTNISDSYKGQMSIYYYLLKHYKKYPVHHVILWWVMRDTEVYLDLEELEELYPKYIERAHNLYKSLKYNNLPLDLIQPDFSSCKYCLIENYCRKKHLNKTRYRAEEHPA